MINHETAAIILAAGKGSRLGMTDIPKPMVEMCGRKLLDYGLYALYSSGFTSDTIIGVVGYKKEALQKHYGLDMRYVHQEELNGTAGALKVALPEIDDAYRNILVLHADDSLFLTPEIISNYLRWHDGRNSDVSVCSQETTILRYMETCMWSIKMEEPKKLRDPHQGGITTDIIQGSVVLEEPFLMNT